MTEWITVKEAGGLLGISSRQVINRIHRGKLKAKKDGRLWQVHSSLSEADKVTGETSEEVFEESGEASPVTGETSQEAYKKLEEMVDYFKGQIEEKDKQISELHQMLMVTERSRQQLLEDKRPFWLKWFKKKLDSQEQ